MAHKYTCERCKTEKERSILGCKGEEQFFRDICEECIMRVPLKDQYGIKLRGEV